MRKAFPFLFFCFLIFFCNCNVGKEQPLFQLLDSSYTGIDFSNDLPNSDSLIALSFEYIYNGSGVAVGDFNNDGRSDVFFTGNIKPSRLYLNQGDMKFKDITESSQINTKGKWASGAAVVDINNDGWLDIYVCVGGLSRDKEKRANLLYINQKNNTFKEEAAAYGIDDSGYSINASFFDYDRDGDLDLYILSTELDPYNWTEFRPRRLNGEAPNTDRFYRNNKISKDPNSNNKKFTDVSAEAGITIGGYGLGMALCDINKDGWTDIYIANDFLSNDIIYVNNQNGTFSDKIDDYLSHTSRNSMGIDMQDFNNDGHTDIMVLDMLPTSNARQKSMFGFFNYDKFQLGIENGYQPQYARNTLQLNNGNGTFSEIGQLAGVDQTDWSWCSLFADFDNDGWQDLFITNGYRQDITNMDFATYSRQIGSSPVGTEEAKAKQMMEKLKELPEIKLPNFMFRNTGNLPFENKTKDWGFDLASYSNGAAYADFDNDGDLDLIVNNIDEKAFVYQNNLQTKSEKDSSNYIRIKLHGKATNFQGVGAKVVISYGKDQSQVRFNSPYRGYLSSVENTLHFGLGHYNTLKEIEVFWQDGHYQRIKKMTSNKELTIKYNETYDEVSEELVAEVIGIRGPDGTLLINITDSFNLNYTHQENDFIDFKIQPILPHKHSQGAPSLAVGDVNGDGFEDFYVSGSSGFRGSLFFQTEKGFEEYNNVFSDSSFHEMGSLLFDADGDDDLDLYIVSGGTNFQNKTEFYQDQIYVNDGRGNFQRSSGLPSITASGCDVSASDFDRDGDLDLFVTGRVVPGAYPSKPKSYLLRNDSKNGKIQFADISDQLPNKGKIGMVSSVLWTDYDNDGFIDLMIAGEWMPVTFLKNNNGKFSKNDVIELPKSTGWWNSLASGDFDRDGDIDYVAGNLGLNTRYKTSIEEPVQMFAKDFDKNGRIDPILSYFIEGENQIAHSRDMLIKQINAMRVRFKTYTQYGNTPFDESFTKQELSDADKLKSVNFASSYIENLGNGNFQMKDLPIEAQVAPIFGILPIGPNDLMLVGNSYATEIMVGQYDACKGIVLRGDGAGNFKNVSLKHSGFFVDKDAKALVKIKLANGKLGYLASRNRGSLELFVHNSRELDPKPPKKIEGKKLDTHAILVRGSGKKHRFEFQYGSSYLSQSSRIIELPSVGSKIKFITVYDSQGNKREVKI